jgi:hypothetical protein
MPVTIALIFLNLINLIGTFDDEVESLPQNLSAGCRTQKNLQHG